MKRPNPYFPFRALLCAFLLQSVSISTTATELLLEQPLVPDSLPIELTSNAETILNWAEDNYPQFFPPPGAITQFFDPWLFRYYPSTDIYAGVNTNSEVWVLGDVFGGLVYISTVEELLATIPPAPPPTAGDKATGKLNDTGITTCSGRISNELSCPQGSYPGQDAEYGRDVTHNDDSDGHAGFSFTKLDANGNPLPASATSWSCVKDNVTGLVWEVKTDDGGLSDKGNTYTWYDPDSSRNGGSAGTLDGGSCSGIRCDTQGYIQAVNGQGLCGANDWRMPTVDELTNILNLDQRYPYINRAWFPNTINWLYWSGSPDAYDSSSAWYVYFNYGYSYSYYKNDSYYVRLVRGGQ
jgi:hypothetical protein